MPTNSASLTNLLKVIVESPRLHAGWLNMLSYLEYVGFAKIVKSQDIHAIDLSTIQHASEEIRHAHLLKRLAQKAGGAGFETYSPANMLCGAAARHYFESVDHACDVALMQTENRAQLCYLYVTWLVEVRALEVYGSYLQVVKEFGLTSPLESLLKEEDKHLSDVTELLAARDPEFAQRRVQFAAIENRAYTEFLQALANAI